MVLKNKKLGQKRSPRFAVVASQFNEFVTKRLLAGCLKEFKKAGVREDSITVVWVPGAFELPVAAMKLARRKDIDAVVCLGAVIRGETFHFELVARESASGIMRAAMDTGKPVIFGVLSTDTIDQANRRSEEKGDNKGIDAARAALDMAEIMAAY